MVNPTEYGFSSKTLWVRPMVPMGVPGGGKPQTSEPKPPADPMADPAALKRAVDRLEQQVKDALLARTTAHMGEQRILKNAFIKFDKDASGSVDYPEFARALEHIGLHQENEGLMGNGGLPAGVVRALFARYDVDGSGSVEYDEFCSILLSPDRATKML